MDIDVIIPVYNGEKFVERTLFSVVKQTHKPAQIIIVNDGSTDKTENIVQRFIECHSLDKVRLITKSHGGLSSARNAGIEASKNSFIAFVDADDIWLPQKLSLQMEKFKQNKQTQLGVVYTNYSDIDSKDEDLLNTNSFKLDPTIRGYVEKTISTGNKIAGSASAVLLKRECFEKAGQFDQNLIYGEDWDMWLRISRIFEFDYIPQVLVKIRRHSSQMSLEYNRIIFGGLDVLNKNLISSNYPQELVKCAEQTLVSYAKLKDILQIIFGHHYNKRFSYLKPLLFPGSGTKFLLLIKLILLRSVKKIFLWNKRS